MPKVWICVFLTVCGALVLLALLRAVFGPRFTDRMVAVNCITTLVTCITAVLAFYLNAPYLLDVALIYALLGFLANVILTRLALQHHRAEKEAEEELPEKTERKEGEVR